MILCMQHFGHCLVAFFCLLCKANLLCRGLTHFNPSQHLRWGDIFFTDWAIIINRWSNTIQFSHRNLTIPLPRIAQHPLCPYTALKHAFILVPASLSGPAFVIQLQPREVWSLWRMKSLTPYLNYWQPRWTWIHLSLADIVFDQAGPLWPFKLKSQQNLSNA